MKNPIPLNIAAICGIIAAVVSLSSIFIAISLSPWFTWTGSWLSDLGRTTLPSAPIFNNGLIMGGALGVVFSLGIRKSGIFSGEESEYGLATLFLTTFFLCFVGIFPVDAGMPHTLASFLFFVFSTITLVLIGNVMRKTEERKLGLAVFVLGVISAISFPFFFAPRPFGMNAVIEMVSSTSMSIFILSYSIRILSSARK